MILPIADGVALIFFFFYSVVTVTKGRCSGDASCGRKAPLNDIYVLPIISNGHFHRLKDEDVARVYQ